MDREFLLVNMSSLVRVFSNMFETIFNEGINFQVDIDSYKDIFEPVK